MHKSFRLTTTEIVNGILQDHIPEASLENFAAGLYDKNCHIPEVLKKLNSSNYESHLNRVIKFIYNLAAFDLHCAIINQPEFIALWDNLSRLQIDPDIKNKIIYWIKRPRNIDNVKLKDLAIERIPIYDENFTQHLTKIFSKDLIKDHEYAQTTANLATAINLSTEIEFIHLDITTMLNQAEPEPNSLFHHTHQLKHLIRSFINAYADQPHTQEIIFEFFYDILESVIDHKDFASAFSIQRALAKSDIYQNSEFTEKLKQHTSCFHKHEINLEKYWLTKFDKREHLAKLSKYENIWEIPCMEYYLYLARDIFATIQDPIELTIAIGSIKSKIIHQQILVTKHSQKQRPFFSHNAYAWLTSQLQSHN